MAAGQKISANGVGLSHPSSEQEAGNTSGKKWSEPWQYSRVLASVLSAYLIADLFAGAIIKSSSTTNKVTSSSASSRYQTIRMSSKVPNAKRQQYKQHGGKTF